jgi:uncharacterized membrane protein
MKNIPQWAILALITLSLFGFIDASYLAIKQYQGEVIPCSITEGCDIVLTSPQAKLLGIPLSVFGTLYYGAIFILSIAGLRNRNIFNWSVYLPIGGFLFSIWLIYAQVAIIQAYCQYCLVSAGITTLLAGISMYIIRLPRE